TGDATGAGICTNRGKSWPIPTSRCVSLRGPLIGSPATNSVRGSGKTVIPSVLLNQLNAESFRVATMSAEPAVRPTIGGDSATPVAFVYVGPIGTEAI